MFIFLYTVSFFEFKPLKSIIISTREQPFNTEIWKTGKGLDDVLNFFFYLEMGFDFF